MPWQSVSSTQSPHNLPGSAGKPCRARYRTIRGDFAARDLENHFANSLEHFCPVLIPDLVS